MADLDRTCRPVKSAALLFVFFILAPLRCNSAEGGLHSYLPGFRNYLAGIVPSKPGFYLRSDVVYYSGTAPRVVLNGQPVENISVDAALGIIEPEYVFPWKIFGANHAVVITQLYNWADLSGRIIGTDIEPSDHRSSFGDTAISPLFLGWHKGYLHYNANLAIFIPTGGYRINRVVNLSRNYWMLDFQFGVTYLNPNTGLDASAVLGYSVNFKNSATDYTSGDVLHLDLAVGRTLKNGLKPGIAGYAQVQVTPDTGSGAIFGSFKSNIYGIGPALQARLSKNSSLMFRYYHEFGAKNHIEGDQYALTYRAAF